MILSQKFDLICYTTYVDSVNGLRQFQYNEWILETLIYYFVVCQGPIGMWVDSNDKSKA